MTQIYVDPEKLREFARRLKDFSRHAEASLTSLDGQLGRLGNSWRDQDFQQFEQHVRSTRRRLIIFAEQAAQTIPSLERDADAMTEYQKVKMPK